MRIAAAPAGVERLLAGLGDDVPGGVGDVDREVDVDRADRRRAAPPAGRRRRPRRRRASGRAGSPPPDRAPRRRSSDIVSAIGRRSAPLPGAGVGADRDGDDAPALRPRAGRRARPSTPARRLVDGGEQAGRGRREHQLGDPDDASAPSVELYSVTAPSVTEAGRGDDAGDGDAGGDVAWSGGGVRGAPSPVSPVEAPLGDQLQHGVGDQVVERSAVAEAGPQIGARHLEAGHLDVDPRHVAGAAARARRGDRRRPSTTG